jgi:hypothetical protein
MNWFYEYWWVVLAVVLTLPLVCVATFAWWLKRRPQLQVEEVIKSWDVFIKLVSALTVIVSGAILIVKYVDQQGQIERQRAGQEQKETNLRRAEFLRQTLAFDTERHQRKRTLFNEAKIVVARLANDGSPTQVDLRRFAELFDAELIGVERYQGAVEAAMVEFRRKLRREPNAPNESFEQLALQLAHACEKELKESEDALLEQHKAITALVTAGDKP